MSRVLVLSQHSGPLDRRIVAEVNSLVSAGRQVTLICLPMALLPACLDARVRVIISLAEAPRSRGKALLKSMLQHLPPRLAHWVRTTRQAWRPLPAVPAWSPYFMQVTPRELFDVIHCHDLDTLPAAIELRRALAPQARLIYDSHELFPFQFLRGSRQQRYWSHIEAASIREADLVITVNESIAGELARLYDLPVPQVLYNSYGTQSTPVPLEKPQFLRHFGATGEGFRVLFQGSFVREKNVLNLVRAFRHCDASMQLFLLGEGPLEAELKLLCKQLGLVNVYFGGWVPQEDLLRYVAHADLGIIPYLGDELLNNRYCTPNKLFEFIEAEVPICASDLPELRRIVAAQGIGDVYPMQTPEAIAQALQMCRARCLKGAFPACKRQEARAKFAWDRQATRLIAMYEALGV